MTNFFRFNFFIKNNLIVTFCSILLCFFSLQVNSQENDNQEVKRIQRAIFIFNFAQQVSWPNIENSQNFKIGVLGPDRTLLDLQGMSLKRRIHGKKVAVVSFKKVKDVKNVQLLYVNQKYNYGIDYILNKISGKNILLVSEDYNFNSSMINMVNVGDSFVYEINLDRMRNEGFSAVPTLRRNAITSTEKWKRLYKKTEESLTIVQEESQEQVSIIKDKEEELKSQKDRITDQLEKIDKKNQEIENLFTETKIQQKKYEEKVLIEKELEKNIQLQLENIKAQKKQIEKSNLDIEKQNEFLNKQRLKIKEQEDFLKVQASEISKTKTINLLLIILASLILIVALFVYLGYLNKKKYNKQLREKNLEIYTQSQELEIKNSELEQFAYIASHDLQEPLNTISSFIGLISEDYEESFDDIGKESLKFIKDASQRMKRLIDSLLEYSRLGRNGPLASVDLSIVYQELIGDLKVIIEETNSKITTTKLPVVTGREIELRLIFQNLIGNAIKFREEGTTPLINISHTKIIDVDKNDTKYWKFSVKDNGIGIPEKHKEKIFAIFQRLHSREKYKGTGIGLAHCKKIVESHGGKIWLTSKEGVGTTFYFTIPI